jgi:putative oxidoreductase
MQKAVSAHASDALLLLGRIAIASVFIPAGLSKLGNLQGFAASLERGGVPFAQVMAPLGALVEFLGGIAIAVGIQVRFAAALMILFTIVATLIAHRFWELQGAARQAQQGQFFKNLGLIGGFLFLVANGGGRYCIDRLWQRRYSGIERRQLWDRRQKTWPVPDQSS